MTVGIERPFRDILSELTIEANEQGLDPFDAYVRMREKMSYLGLQALDYCSSSITSGGHARDDSLGMGDVIRKNTDTAMDLCDELYGVGQLNPRTSVEAVVLGKIAWKQSDYMTFWLTTMSGIPAAGHGVLQSIRSFRQELAGGMQRSDSLDMDLYDSKETAERRAPQYFEHAQIFADTVKHHAPSPVDRLIRLIDPEMSLGAQTENVFARLMGTGVFKVAIARTGLGISDKVMRPRLRQDSETLVSFGATVFDTDTREQLVLVEQEP
jgi:hypothetical protein